MKNILKIIFTILVIIFMGYVIYRNVAMRHVPKTDLIKNEATSKLYRSIMPNTDNPKWITYFYNNDATINTIPLDMKYNIAYKESGSSLSTIKEEDIKEVYDKIFGKGTYKTTNSFLGGCNTYYYNSLNKIYKYNDRTPCKNININILSKVVDAEEKDNSFNLTVEIVYIDNQNKVVYKECDSDLKNCKGIIKKNFDEFDEADLEENKYDLHEYKFYFINKDGIYIFDHNEKIK